MSADLDPARIEALLAAHASPIGRPLHVVAESGSTSDDAKQAARRGAPHGAAFVADRQSAGRGRMGHAWHSPPGENLYASWVLRPRVPARLLPPLSLAGGLAVLDAVRELEGARLEPRLKWPNDVLVSGRKLAGVLVEALLAGDRVDAVVVGIGVNVRARAFPPPLDAIATSLALEGAGALDRGLLFSVLSAALARRVAQFETEGVASLAREVRAADALAGQEIAIDGARGTAAGLDDEGRLLVRGADGVLRAFAAGEVSIGTRPRGA